MGRGGSDHRPVADGILQGGERRRIGRRCGHVELEIAGRENAAAPRARRSALRRGRAGKAEIEPLQKMRDGLRKAPPAPERIFREPAIDQDHRHAAIRGFDDHVRPEIGFHEQSEVGPPMIEEAADEARNVDRHELMHDAARQALLGEIARCNGAGRDQDGDAPRANPLDQRQHAGKLADACAVQPDQRSVRPRDAALAAPFGKTLTMFFAALGPARKQHRGEWCRRPRHQAIDHQAGGQSAHDAMPPALICEIVGALRQPVEFVFQLLAGVFEGAASASRETKIGPLAAMPIRPNGRLIAVRSQLSSSIRRLDAIATG